MERGQFSRLRRALHAGRYRRALDELLARPDPDDPSWWRLLAWARWHLGDPEGIRDAERAARMARRGAGWAWQDLGALRFRAGDWAVKRAGSERAARVYKTQKEAEQFGRELARKDKTEFVLHGRDGKIRDKDSYGNDPFPPRDKEH